MVRRDYEDLWNGGGLKAIIISLGKVIVLTEMKLNNALKEHIVGYK